MTGVMQVSLYGLIALASAILSIAEGTAFPDAFTMPMAVMALFVTERWKLFALKVRWANCLGLAAFALGVWELYTGTAEARLLSLAHVLVYLTWIVLFLEKNSYLYWILCALAMLHVAIGSVLTTTPQFGMLCLLFLMAAIWTLSVFTLYRAQIAFGFGQQAMGGDRSLLGEAAQSRDAGAFPWHRPSLVNSTLTMGSQQSWISRQFVLCVVVTGVLSLLMGAAFFTLTPRIWIGSISPFTDTPDTALRILRSGYTEEVKLGDIGQILESTHQVMEVRLFDDENGQPVSVADYAQQLGMDEPLFRGAVLGEYAFGRWRTGEVGSQKYRELSVPSVPNVRRVVRQEYRLEPTDSETLFAIPPHNACRIESGSRGPVRQRTITRVLLRGASVSSRDSVRYTVFSDKPKPSGVLRAVRATSRWAMSAQNPDSEILEYYKRLPSGLDRLERQARQVAGPEADGASPNDRARRLLVHLRNSGQYTYSLDAAIQDANIDAVEDFLFNRKQGHCEYFASALTLMLRAIQIPARLASGFKGGDLNESTGYFIVQQRHAHVWVEAYLDNQWVILDPTPASRSDSVKSLAPKDNVFTQLHRFFTDLWSHQIVGMSMAEQRTQVYEPMKEILNSASDTFESTFRQDSGGMRDYVRVLAWVAGAILLIMLGAGAVLGRRSGEEGIQSSWLSRVMTTITRFLNWVLPREADLGQGLSWRGKLRRWWDSVRLRWLGRQSSSAIRVEFYERYLRLLKSAGRQPSPEQTPREFLAACEPTWHDELAEHRLSDVPATIVAQYYRVRFGSEPLTVEELHWLDDQLFELERRGVHRKPR